MKRAVIVHCWDGYPNYCWYPQINFEKIKSKAKSFAVIHSDDDPFVPLKFGDLFKEQLGAKLIIKHQMGHFSGLVDETKSVTSLPEITKAILEMMI